MPLMSLCKACSETHLTLIFCSNRWLSKILPQEDSQYVGYVQVEV